MNKKEIEERLYNSIQDAPINLKDKLKNTEVEKMIEHDNITSQENKNKGFAKWKPFVAVATIMIVFLAGYFGYYTQYRAVDSIVYLDVNPSVEISTNKQDKVLDIRALNDDAEDYLDNYEFKGKDLDEVSIELIDRFIDKGYLDQSHNTILISIRNENEEKSKEQKERLNTKVKEYLEDKNIKPVVLAQSIKEEDDDFDETYEISEGRLIFIEKLIRANENFKIQDLVDLSLEELVTLAEDNNIDVKSIIDDYYDDMDDDDMVDDDDDMDDEDDDDDMDDDEMDDEDLITRERAEEIAIDRVGGGEVEEIELDEDDGRYKYEIEVKHNGYEYELEIDARNGDIIEFERDDMDDDDDMDDEDDDMDDDDDIDDDEDDD